MSSQMTPSPAKPGLHVQAKAPTLFVQAAFGLQWSM
jgi:hypothetical protein